LTGERSVIEHETDKSAGALSSSRLAVDLGPHLCSIVLNVLRPVCGLDRSADNRSRAHMASDLRKHLWGGQDSNLRPTDYECVYAQRCDLRKRLEVAADVRV
jgi:hypothetical protein